MATKLNPRYGIVLAAASIFRYLMDRPYAQNALNLRPRNYLTKIEKHAKREIN